MSSRGRRLDRLYGALTVAQRASSLLTSWKQGRKPDDALWSTIPDEDRAAFRRSIALILAATRQAPYLLLLRGWVGALDATYELVSTRRRLGGDILALGSHIRERTKEPVTRREYRRREQELREELVPMDVLVEIAIERYDRFIDADYTDHPGERVLSDEGWTLARSEAEKELIELFRAGTLLGEQQDGAIQISAGSFYDWLREPMPVCSESGCGYEVFSDRQAVEVASQQRTRRLVDELIIGAPGRADLPLDLEGPWPDVPSAETAYALLERADVIALRDGIQGRWRELRCFEMVLADLAVKQLNGEDALPVETGEVLRDVRRHPIALHEKVTPYAGDVELPEPDAADFALLRELIARSAEQSTSRRRRLW